MKNITIEQIEEKITLNQKMPRKLKHWQVKKAQFEHQLELQKQKQAVAKAKADAFKLKTEKI